MSFPLNTLKNLLNKPIATTGVVLSVNNTEGTSEVTLVTQNGFMVATARGLLTVGNKVSIEGGVAFRLLPPTTIIEV